MSIPKKLKHSFCSLAFNSMAVAPFGAIRVCCNNYKLPEDENGKRISFNDPNFDIKKALNNSFHKELRKSMLEGERHESCHRCWDIENHGGQSYRQSWNERYGKHFTTYERNTHPDGSIEDVQAHYIEVTLGNKCNLRCRMCNPFSSSPWIKEATDLNFYDPHVLEDLKNYDWYEKPQFHKAMNAIITNSDRLNFLGGEPLLINEHIDILQRCIDLGVSHRIEIQYNTNLTVLPEKITKIWSKFKKVFLNISVDAYQDLNTYIRYPTQWPKLENNIKRLALVRKDANLDLSIHCTFQALNVSRLDDLYYWVFNEMGERGLRPIPFVIYVNYPKYLDPKVLPKKIKDLAYERQKKFIDMAKGLRLDYQAQAWLDMMNSHVENLHNEFETEEQKTLWEEFITKTKQIDAYRKQKITDHLPEFAEYF